MKLLIIVLLLLFPCFGEEKNNKNNQKIEKKEDNKNIKQYTYEQYCRVHFYYLEHPEKFVDYYKKEFFNGVSPDIALGFVTTKMIHNLKLGGCVW